jgi:hypothetical protein
MATVEGVVTEMGSIYSHDIVAYKPAGRTLWLSNIEYTPAQEKCKAANEALFGRD